MWSTPSPRSVPPCGLSERASRPRSKSIWSLRMDLANGRWPHKPLVAGIAAAQAAIRLARLCGSAIYWHEPVAADQRLWSAISLHSLLSFFGSEAIFSRRADERPQPARRLIELPRLTRSERLALWRGFSAD